MGTLRHYTTEEISFVRKNVKGKTYAEMLALFNKRFNFSLTLKQFETLMYKHKLHNGLGTINGYPPGNKGKTHEPWRGNYSPVGTERIDAGYVVIKTADPNVWNRKHTAIWEAANGKVPKGHIVIFLDKNKKNISLDNLALVSRSVHQLMNKMKLYTTNREITKANIAVCEIKKKIAELKKKSFSGIKSRKIIFQHSNGDQAFVIKHKGRYIPVRETKRGNFIRLRVKKLKSRTTRKQAQHELFEYAKSKGWQRV